MLSRPQASRRLVGSIGVILAAVAASLAGPASAPAIISQTKVIDAGATLVGEPEAAMSEDGSGGVVYLKQVDGRAHVFAVPYENGEWRNAQRVDVGQNFDSSWPRIAAGDNGRLLVTWVQDFGPALDRMYSATLDPGANGFQAPVPVDFDIGKATSAFPGLAMARGGQAYLIYNVVTDTSASNPPGYLGLDVRVARYSNRLWTLVGSRIDRNSALPMRTPTEAISPQVGIDDSGQTVVAWLEPDDEFIDRIWARRVFGGQTGIPVQVSPSTFNNQPLRGGVNGFSLDVSGFGGATAAFSQQPGQTGALDATRIMINNIPDVFAIGGDKFGEAILADETARGAVGAPAVGTDAEGNFATVFPSGPATFLSTGDPFSVAGVERIDKGGSSIEGTPAIDLADSGAATVVWREQRSGGGVVVIQERRADGVVEEVAATAPLGGAPGPPAFGGSGFGDGIVTWSQGAGAGRQVAAAVVDAPPDPFLVLVPDGFQRKEEVKITWDPSPSAIGKVSYSISVDDEPVREGIKDEKVLLNPRQIEDGRHRVQVFAVDTTGQETGSSVGRVEVDRTAPKVKLKLKGGKAVEVEIDDGPKSESSGLAGGRINYGDGRTDKAKGKGKSATSARRVHRFGKPGSYKIRVEAKDRAGNETSKRLTVKVR